MLVLGFVLVGRKAQNNTRNGHFEFYCGTRLTFSLILGLEQARVQDQRNVDRFLDDGDRIYRVMQAARHVGERLVWVTGHW